MPRPARRSDRGRPWGARPGRRAVLGALVAGTAGCSAVGPQQEAPTPAVAPSPAGTPPRARTDADEEARRALLAGVEGLRAGAAALAGTASLVPAVVAALDEQSRALSTRADARRPPAPAPTPAASVADLVDALAVAATTASSRLERALSGPMARLTAAVAAGHAVAADALARAGALPAPAGLPPAGGPGAAGRPVVPALRPAPGAARARSRAREVEAQARYACGVAAVHLEGDVLAAALGLRSVHDETVAALGESLSGEPAAAAQQPREAWALPFPVVDDVTAATLAARVEDACADAWADVVAASSGADRTDAATAVTVRALQGARWRDRLGLGADLTPLPGLSGRT